MGTAQPLPHMGLGQMRSTKGGKSRGYHTIHGATMGRGREKRSRYMEATIVWEEQGCRTPLGGGASGQGFRVNVSLCGSLQGGVDDEVTLSAYITIALLEIPLPITVRTCNPSSQT